MYFRPGLPYPTLPYLTLPYHQGSQHGGHISFGPMRNPDVTGLCLRIYVELYMNACNLSTEISQFKLNI